MRFAHVGDNGDIRTRQPGQERNFPAFAHAHFQHERFGIRRRGQYRQWQSDFVVQFPSVLCTRYRTASTEATMSLVVVLPLLPVMAATAAFSVDK